MLLLIFADWNKVAVVDQNVGGHQDGISEKSSGCGQAPRHLVLVGVSAFQKTFRRDGRQDPGELRHLRHIALSKKGVPGDVEAASQEVQSYLAAVGPERFRVIDSGQRMVIRDEIKRL